MTFFKTFIKELLDEGHTVDIAANISSSKIPDCYTEWGCKVYPLSCSRSPLDKSNLVAIKEIKQLVSDNKYDIVHCHTPIAAMCTRLACRKFRKQGTKVFYTAHGFHFYKGAPLKNWLLFYPIEKICAYLTDLLITINKEDYERAKKKLKAKKVAYVPGVGIDVAKFADVVVDRVSKRAEIRIPENSFLLLSVGELNANKNHEVVIRAIAKIGNPDVHYAVAGKGNLEEYLKSLAKELNIEEQVHLLGYRKDISELYSVADVCVFPSIREGFGLAALEGMAAGLPLLISDNRGTREYSTHNINAIVCNCNDVDAYASGIETLKNDVELYKSMGEYNKKFAWQYDISSINKIMSELYYK